MSDVLCLMSDVLFMMSDVCLVNREFTVLFISTLTSAVRIPGTSENVSPMTETLNSKF